LRASTAPPLPAHPRSAHQVPATDPDGHRLAPERHAGRAGPLRVYMQMRLARVSGVADPTQRLARTDAVTRPGEHTAMPHVGEEYPVPRALEDYVIPRHVLPVRLGHGKVREAVARFDHTAGAGCDDGIPEDEVRCRVARQDAMRAAAGGVHAHQVDAVALATPGAEPPLRPKRFHVRAHQRAAPTSHNEVGPAPEWRLELEWHARHPGTAERPGDDGRQDGNREHRR